MIELTIVASILVIAYFVGTRRERRHLQSLERRELEFAYIPILSGDDPVWDLKDHQSYFVTASTVVAGDYFKHFWASLRNLFGGPVTAYESLLDRGKREVLVRLKEQMPDASEILGVRTESVRLTLFTVQIMAYGTAIVREKKSISNV
jgi:uncharacterized protein YbjQ (UPF0145 family)